jgi:hypothetical protein
METKGYGKGKAIPVTPCSPVVHRGTYCLNLQGLRVSQASGPQEAARLPASCCPLVCLSHQP